MKNYLKESGVRIVIYIALVILIQYYALYVLVYSDIDSTQHILAGYIFMNVFIPLASAWNPVSNVILGCTGMFLIIVAIGETVFYVGAC